MLARERESRVEAGSWGGLEWKATQVCLWRRSSEVKRPHRTLKENNIGEGKHGVKPLGMMNGAPWRDCMIQSGMLGSFRGLVKGLPDSLKDYPLDCVLGAFVYLLAF